MKVYLACPYSGMESKGFFEATKSAGLLMQMGFKVFSPITHGHGIASLMAMDMPHAFWMDQCRPLLEWADELFVLDIQGWQESKGVQMEIRWAREMNKTVKLCTIARGHKSLKRLRVM